ncbi:hypothetical protein NE237_009375 [Protea cynaroides]|uniref:Uncharacterized protein n=1 Tax=Protea cynaroides TaxID=273540 RepID=A0A9Q0R084_9MAGN|nr:hypothetical protein NE237_009375 [Protea cynaroides]
MQLTFVRGKMQLSVVQISNCSNLMRPSSSSVGLLSHLQNDFKIGNESMGVNYPDDGSLGNSKWFSGLLWTSSKFRFSCISKVMLLGPFSFQFPTNIAVEFVHEKSRGDG